eukprot:gene32648-39473_t
MAEQSPRNNPRSKSGGIGFEDAPDDNLEDSSEKAQKVATFMGGTNTLEQGSSKAGKVHTYFGQSHDADSSDDEHDNVVPDLPSKSNPGFNFFANFDHIVPFQNILESFNIFKHKPTSDTASNTKAGASTNKAHFSADGVETIQTTDTLLKTKSFDIKEFQRTQEIQRQNSSAHKISRFRPAEPKWDGSFSLDAELANAIYRTPENDPSGKTIFTVTRDEAKDATPWKACGQDKDFLPPSLAQINPRLKKQIFAHLTSVIANLTKQYESFPSALTQQQSNEKAAIGADLANLTRVKEEIEKDLKREEKEAKKKTGSTKSGDKAASGKGSAGASNKGDGKGGSKKAKDVKLFGM